MIIIAVSTVATVVSIIIIIIIINIVFFGSSVCGKEERKGLTSQSIFMLCTMFFCLPSALIFLIVFFCLYQLLI